MKKIIALSLIFVMIMVAFVGCSEKPESQQPETESAPPSEAVSEGSEKLVIGFLPASLNADYHIDALEGAQTTADALGVELLVQAPSKEDDFASAVQIMEDMVTQGVDAIILNTNSPESLAPAVIKANQAGIPVIVYSTFVRMEDFGAEIYCYIVFDEVAACRDLVDWMNEYTGGAAAEVAIIEGVPSNYVKQRNEGFRGQIEDKYSDLYEIVAVGYGDWDTDKGFVAAQDIFQAYPKVSIMFAMNDNMALGAAQALNQAGRQGEVVIMGMDGSRAAFQGIADGLIDATIECNPIGQGALAVQLAMQAAKGEPLSSDIDGDQIFIDLNIVDKTNVHEYLS